MSDSAAASRPPLAERLLANPGGILELIASDYRVSTFEVVRALPEKHMARCRVSKRCCRRWRGSKQRKRQQQRGGRVAQLANGTSSGSRCRGTTGLRPWNCGIDVLAHAEGL